MRYPRDRNGKRFCSLCREWKPVEEFPKIRSKETPRKRWCRPCNSKKQGEANKKRRERLRKIRFSQENQEEVL